jgi:hypothetical protein
MVNGMSSCSDALADFFNSVERVFNHLGEVYTRTLPTPPVDEEEFFKSYRTVLDNLGLLIRKLKQRRPRECFLADMLSCLV